MSDLDGGFEEKPSADDAPDECQYVGCERPPKKAIRYRDPKEYVCYCYDHSVDLYQDRSDAKYRTALR